jgi:hypothetical protein
VYLRRQGLLSSFVPEFPRSRGFTKRFPGSSMMTRRGRRRANLRRDDVPPIDQDREAPSDASGEHLRLRVSPT